MAKRFYKKVAVVADRDGHQIELDGRVLKTPGKYPLIFTSPKSAEIVADEWRDQGDEIKPETMPCTRLMNVACEMTEARRPELIAEFRKYCETDLLCYRSAHPQDLAARQNERWQPVLDWGAKKHGIALVTTTGLDAVRQPEQSLKTAEQIAGNLTDIDLTMLLHFTASLGSGILSLAVLEQYLDIENGFELSKLDEMFQNERWGEDEEAMSRDALLLSDLKAISALI